MPRRGPGHLNRVAGGDVRGGRGGWSGGPDDEVVGNRVVFRHESPPVRRTGVRAGSPRCRSWRGSAGRAGLPAARVRDARVERLRVDLLSPPRPNPFGASAAVGVAAGPLHGTRLLMRVARWTRLPRGVQVGAELAVDGHVRPLRPDGGAGQSGFAEQLGRAGIAGELLLERARATGRRRGGVAGALDRMRARAERGVRAGLPARDAALARGMVLGQDERIDETTRQDWRDSGLSHLLAVSGQNVMLLVALALPFPEDNVWTLSEVERRAMGYQKLPTSLESALAVMEGPSWSQRRWGSTSSTFSCGTSGPSGRPTSSAGHSAGAEAVPVAVVRAHTQNFGQLRAAAPAWEKKRVSSGWSGARDSDKSDARRDG